MVGSKGKEAQASSGTWSAVNQRQNQLLLALRHSLHRAFRPSRFFLLPDAAARAQSNNLEVVDSFRVIGIAFGYAGYE
jgi:hypothetical protein